MNKILIFDGTPKRRNSHCMNIDANQYELFVYENGSIVSSSDHVNSETRSFDLILLHGNDDHAFRSLKCKGPVVYYGGDGGGKTKNWVPRSVSSDSPLSRSELGSFLNMFFDGSGKKVEDVIDVVWHKNSDSILALRLLCEAWLLTDGGTQEKVNGIAVNAPTKAENWFKPFGKSPSDENAEAIIAQVGAKTDGEKAKIKAVLRPPTGSVITSKVVDDCLAVLKI